MRMIKLSTVYQLVLTALMLGACFSSVVEGRLGALSRNAAITPTVMPATLARDSPPSGMNQVANFTDPLGNGAQNSAKVQVQVQVQANGNAKAEGSARGPGNANVSANTDGPGNAVASAISNLPSDDKTLALPVAAGQSANILLPTTTPDALAAPQVVVNENLVNLRRGPSTFYAIAGSAARGQTFAMVARTEDYHWWQICCFNNERVWVSDQVVYVYGAINTLAVVPNPVVPLEKVAAVEAAPTLPPPTLAPTAPAPTPTPNGLDFDLVAQEQFEEAITPRIYLYVYAGAEGLGGYTLHVKKDGVDLPVSVTSFGGQPGMTWPLPLPRQRFYNMKLEYRGTPGPGAWEIQLVDFSGKVVGPPAVFHLSGNDQTQEMYVRYQKRS
ncbi:MAG: SH3 domain-containing protein [Caldilineaceae bacterium]